MTSFRQRLSPWARALLILVASFALAMPVLVHHYREAHTPRPAIWPLPEDPTAARKATLINKLLPLVQASNRELLDDRERLHKLHARAVEEEPLRKRDMKWLREQAQRYRLDPPQDNPPSERFLSLLKRRMDAIPASLALAQAAMESAWGTSRFAREGNNYFGHWCFEPGCGIVPARRAKGARHEVARFDSPQESVRRYMRNLNSHPRYQSLRLIRQRQRDSGQTPDGYAMAAGLEGYSGIGNEYIRAIRALIRSNELDRFSSW